MKVPSWDFDIINEKDRNWSPIKEPSLAFDISSKKIIKIQAEFENLDNSKHTSYLLSRRELDVALWYFIPQDEKFATNLSGYDVSQEACCCRQLLK